MSIRGGPFRTGSTGVSTNHSNSNSSNNNNNHSNRHSSRSVAGGSIRTMNMKKASHTTGATTTATPTNHRVKNSNNNNNKTGSIQIRPYAQPPQLPTNYYESTAQVMLSGCLTMVQERLKQTSTSISSSSFTSYTSISTATTTPNQLSLQSAYQTSVDLVRHQLGVRFYQDIVQNIIAASILILPPLHDHQQQQHYGLLPYLTQQYAIYMEYISLLKHVCLPLDRTHAWQWIDTSTSDTHQQHNPPPPPTSTTGTDEDFYQWCRGTATATTTTVSTANAMPPSMSSSSTLPFHPQHPSSSSMHHHLHTPYQTMWSVGLAIWIRRLQFLKYDTPIYQQWMDRFLQDWNPTTTIATTMSTKDGMEKEERQLLHQIWYMWQDLHVLSTLPIQTDLQKYWTKQSVEWQNTATSSSYSIADFVTFCHDRMQHLHLYYRNIIQPIGWLYHIFDTCFIQHHMSVQFLFNDVYFFPLLHEHLFHKNESSGTVSAHDRMTGGSPPYHTIQQLWILAGRIPNGQAWMSQAIQRYAKQEGLIRIRYAETTATTMDTTDAATTTMSTTANPAIATTTTTAIEDLLDLQYALNTLVQQLPKGAANTPTKSTSTNDTTNTAPTTTNMIISFKSVWEEVVNVDVYPMSIAEQLAKFLDVTLRSNKKMDTLAQPSTTGATTTMTTTSTTTTTSPTVLTSSSALISEFGWLQRIIHGIFVPLQSKDIFEAFYKRDLAKRLLWNRIVSMDAEKYICSLLKAECGTAYTSKIEGMFQDVDWSREIMLVYKQSQVKSTLTSSESHNSSISMGNDVEVEVQVLTTGYWPVYPVYSSLIIPDTLKIPQEQFESHYHNKHQGRRMVWQYALGHCVVRVNGYNKPYELLVSLCQALVLVQFTSDKVSLSLPQLLQATGLNDRNEMERILQSLALGKDGTRILRKLEHTAEPGKKTKVLMTIDDRDTFIINTKFESKSRRIRITNIMMKETKEEREKTVETVSRDRLYLIDAVLVRIMKARKTILHQALIPQVMEQVKVPAQSSDVKKRIESLIEREYMERDTKDHNRYNYLA